VSAHADMPITVSPAVRELVKDSPPALPLPWDVIAPHEVRAMVNHGKTLEELAAAGGLSACEAVAIIEDRAWREMPPANAFRRLAKLVREHGARTASESA
jgi:hypothetical protein